MATKRISIDSEAYDHLVKARTNPTESFSSVIKRAEWKKELAKKNRKPGAALLKAILANEPMSETSLNRIESARSVPNEASRQKPIAKKMTMRDRRCGY